VLVHAQVIGQLVDTGSQNSDLHLGRTGVTLMGCVVQDYLGLLLFENHGFFHLSINSPLTK